MVLKAFDLFKDILLNLKNILKRSYSSNKNHLESLWNKLIILPANYKVKILFKTLYSIKQKPENLARLFMVYKICSSVCLFVCFIVEPQEG